MEQIPAKTILSSYMENGWFGSNYNMNLYRGCCHGCIYCDSRSGCYGITDFDSVRVKNNALAILDRELRSKQKAGIVITGSMSDSYNPFEGKYKLTRGALELFARHGFGAVIDTKSDLVLRDLDLLLQIKKHSPAIVNFTITTADDGLCRKIEPNTCPSGARYKAIKSLSEAGISCGVLLMPILPFVNDTAENIAAIVEKAAESGARWIYAGSSFGVTLRQNQRTYFLDKADRLFPGLSEQYIKTYGTAYECVSEKNALLKKAFRDACQKYGLLYRMPEISLKIKSDYDSSQFTLF